MKAVLLETKNGSRLPALPERGEPSPTALTEPSRLKVVLFDGGSNASRESTIREADTPAMTIQAGVNRRPITTPAVNHGGGQARVVRLTPRALARLQSFPDTYILPDDRRVAGRIVGNAVPPLLMQRIIEANNERSD
jgi:DNA (cytosine-5)-methyltransferase 1